MELYKTRVIPKSAFSTALRGDTLFGQICWSIAYTQGGDRLEKLLADYETNPFLVVSDPMAIGYLPKPTLPAAMLGEKNEEKKINRKKVWLTPDALTRGSYSEAVDDKKAKYELKELVTVHNSLDYRSFRTGSDPFAPYSVTESLLGEMELYFLLDTERFDVEELWAILRFVGDHGYGKDISIGKGRFTVSDIEAVSLPDEGRVFMTLGPSVFEGGEFDDMWYDTFVRFGKHGGSRAKGNAFKRPLLMADKGAVVYYDDSRKMQYIGKGVRGISATHSDTVHQGYTIVTAIGEVKQ